MELSPEQRQLMRNALAATSQINDCLEALRQSGIACNIRCDGLHNTRWMLDAKAIIKREHYD